jgi:hypothetical protein
MMITRTHAHTHTQEAAKKAEAVEEEALRIVSNIQGFLEKFDTTTRFCRT